MYIKFKSKSLALIVTIVIKNHFRIKLNAFKRSMLIWKFKWDKNWGLLSRILDAMKRQKKEGKRRAKQKSRSVHLIFCFNPFTVWTDMAILKCATFTLLWWIWGTSNAKRLSIFQSLYKNWIKIFFVIRELDTEFLWLCLQMCQLCGSFVTTDYYHLLIWWTC